MRIPRSDVSHRVANARAVQLTGADRREEIQIKRCFEGSRALVGLDRVHEKLR